MRWKYSSTVVFSCCIYSISSYFRTSILICWSSTRARPSGFCFSCRILHEKQLDFPVVYSETVQGFPGRPIGIPDDVRSVPDDVIWPEIWGDGKRFNSISTYWDDGNTANGDGFRRHPCNSKSNDNWSSWYF